jgi:signal transduction histidine kinase
MPLAVPEHPEKAEDDAHNCDGIELPTALLTRWGSFADRHLEEQYRREHINPRLQRSIPYFVLGLTIVVVTQVILRLTFLGVQSYRSPIVLLPALNECIGLTGVVFSRAVARYKLSLGWMEACAMIVLCSIGTILHFPERLSSALEHEPYHGGSALFALRYASVLVYCGIFIPLRPALFHVFCAVIYTAAAVCELGLEATPDPVAVVLYAVVTLIVGSGRGSIVATERSQWYFHQTVQAAMLESRAKERDRMAKTLALTEASIAQEARSRLVRIVMHDLRSPLLAVLNISEGMAGWLLDSASKDARVSSGLGVLRSCSTMMERIVSDMLDFERISSGRMAIVLRSCKLHQLLEEASLTFDGVAKSKGVELLVLPLLPELGQLELHADATRLRQCLHNGISNALKFTEKGGRVALRAWAEPLRPPLGPGAWTLSIAVEDTGVGLSAAELKVLQSGILFAQVGRGQLQGNGGTGLGLTICREILKLHSGHLSISSDGPGLGTQFKIVVNVREQREAERAKAAGRELEPLLLPPAESSGPDPDSHIALSPASECVDPTDAHSLETPTSSPAFTPTFAQAELSDLEKGSDAWMAPLSACAHTWRPSAAHSGAGGLDGCALGENGSMADGSSGRQSRSGSFVLTTIAHVRRMPSLSHVLSKIAEPLPPMAIRAEHLGHGSQQATQPPSPSASSRLGPFDMLSIKPFAASSGKPRILHVEVRA